MTRENQSVMAQIPNEVIEEIKSRADIVQVLSQFIQMKRAGSNFRALCPFHKEKTPSFMISPQKQIYHCFGCHKGGNVFSFIMDYENVSFLEAVKKLAGEYGIDVEHYLKSGSYQKSEDKDRIFSLNQKSAKLYHQSLLGSEFASNYFKQRQIPESIISSFQLGFAPDSWNFLLNQLNDEEKQIASKAGLVVSKETSTFDYFRNRVLFPIFNTQTNVIGFGGRRLNEEQNPKYLNTPETPVYNKRFVLYGLSHAINGIREEKTCYFVEGYMDVLRMHQFGITNVVATSGTALTEGHARLIARYCDKVYLIYDSDEAGMNATIRSIPHLLTSKINIYVVPLPKGSDPDTILLKYGKEKFEHYVSLAVDFIEFQFRYYSKQGLLNDQVEKAKILNQIRDQLAHIKDEMLRQLLTQKVEEMFKISIPNISAHEERTVKTETKDDFLHVLDQDHNQLDKEILLVLLTDRAEMIKSLIVDIKPTILELQKSKKIVNHFIHEFEDHGFVNIKELEAKSTLIQQLKDMSDLKFTDYSEPKFHGYVFSLKIKIIDKMIKVLKSDLREENIEEILHLQQIRSQYKNELIEQSSQSEE